MKIEISTKDETSVKMNKGELLFCAAGQIILCCEGREIRYDYGNISIHNFMNGGYWSGPDWPWYKITNIKKKER